VLPSDQFLFCACGRHRDIPSLLTIDNLPSNITPGNSYRGTECNYDLKWAISAAERAVM